MIRKLTLAATLAATALAMIAAAAPAANADFRDFYVTDQDDVICSSSPTNCVDGGYVAEMDFYNSANQYYGSCDAEFTVMYSDWGEMTVDPIEFQDCETVGLLGWLPEIETCGSAIQQQYPVLEYTLGQLFLPVGALPYVEIPICYGLGPVHSRSEYFNRITLQPSGPGQWAQTDISGTGGMKITNAAVQNTTPEDNVKIVLGTP